MKYLALVAACAAALTLYTDRIQAAKPATCTIQEIRVAGLKLGVPAFDGWYAIDELRAAARRACAKLPARWAWINRDFTRATQMVDRLYPGLYHGSWAHRCASSEGGHGAWVPNREGSGAGGWLQFIDSTFWSVIDGGITRARAHGVRIPAYARSWYSPIGQAIAASEMLFDGRRGEWTGWTC